MPMNGYNTGRDVTVQLYGNYGEMLSFLVRTRFTARQDTNDIRVKRHDGIISILRIPDGWQGTLDYTRQNSAVDDYVAKLEDDYYNGADIAPAQITETIQEGGSVVSQFRYTGVYFKMDTVGDRVGDDVVKQTLSWMGDRRRKIV